MGPNSRALLQTVSGADLSNEAHPFASWREIFIAGAHGARAQGSQYVGELGWELHMPTETAAAVFESADQRRARLQTCQCRLIAPSNRSGWRRATGRGAATSQAMTRRLRPAWPSRSSSQRISLFQGREALEAQRRDGRCASGWPASRSTTRRPSFSGARRIFRNGEKAGYLASGGWGYSLDRNIGYGYVRNPDGVDADYLGIGQI